MILKTKTPLPESEKELEPLILDGISQLLDNGHNMPRDFKREPLTTNEKTYILVTLYKELEDEELPAGLLYLYGHIIDYIKKLIVYN